MPKRRKKSSTRKRTGIKLVKLVHAKPPKKWLAVFDKNGKTYHRWFGAHGYEDYTMHKDQKRRANYRIRHRKDLRTKNPMRSGYLSYFILWNKPSLRLSVKDYRRRLAVYNRSGVFPTGSRYRRLSGGKLRRSKRRRSGRISAKYLPRSLSPKDRRKQKVGIEKARRMYKKGKYVDRPNVKSPRRKSKHIRKALRMYSGVRSVTPRSTKLSIQSGCSKRAMRRIVRKGRGAYYSSGSRPNQTSDSWAYARLASALTGGRASCVDAHILRDGCKKNSKALREMGKTCGCRKR
jgi:hypothetical protein